MGLNGPLVIVHFRRWVCHGRPWVTRGRRWVCRVIPLGLSWDSMGVRERPMVSHELLWAFMLVHALPINSRGRPSVSFRRLLAPMSLSWASTGDPWAPFGLPSDYMDVRWRPRVSHGYLLGNRGRPWVSPLYIHGSPLIGLPLAPTAVLCESWAPMGVHG